MLPPVEAPTDAGGGHGHDPRPRRVPARAARRRAPARQSPTWACRRPRATCPTAGRASSTWRAAPRGAFEERARAHGRARPAQRDIRALRARHHRRHHRGLPEQRPHVPQRLLALEGQALRPRPLSARAAPSRCASTGRAIVRVFCDIHSHMSAFILVFAHRYFAVTDARGRVPHRRRAARAPTPWSVWHPAQTRQARVRAGSRRRAASVELDFALSMKPPLHPHEPHLPGQRRRWPSSPSASPSPS